MSKEIVNKKTKKLCKKIGLTMIGISLLMAAICLTVMAFQAGLLSGFLVMSICGLILGLILSDLDLDI